MSFFDFFQREAGLLQTSKRVEQQVDEFLSIVVDAGEVFRAAFHVYLTAGPSTTFEDQFETINDLEHKGDDLRREIETELYTKTLIPDLRSDVLQLVENIDKVTNLYKSNLFRLSIQRPEIPKTLHSEYERLAEAAVECANALIETTRSFFKDHTVVRDGAKQVAELETRADEISTPLLRDIFNSDLELAHKMQLMYFVERLDAIANQAEDISDHLSISAIKRRICI